MERKDVSSSIEVYRLPPDRNHPSLVSAMPPFRESAQEYLQRSLDALIAVDQQLAAWLLKMRSLNLKAVVFGGWARDRVIELTHGRNIESRDIDFVVDGSVSVVKSLPKDAVVNPFGGFGVQAQTIHLDAWNLADTYLIRRNHLPVTFEQLPLTADYTVNAIAFKPVQFFNQPEIIDCGAINAIKASHLDFAADEVAQPLIQAARAIILAVRLELTPSPAVRSFVQIVVESVDSREIVKAGIRSYCPALLVSAALQLLSDITTEGK